MSNTIVVCGATGRVGNALTGQLLAQGHSVRVVGRNADRLAGSIARGAQPWIGSLDDPKFMARATRGADRVLAMVPPHYGHADQRAWGRSVADAIAAGTQVSRVKTVVTLSSLGADLPDGVGGQLAGLYEMEQRFNLIPGINLLHVRCGIFLENLLAGIPLIRNAGINGSMFDPDHPVPMIATRDVASRLAELLGRKALSGREVTELPGPRDYTHRQVTGVIGSAIGRPDLQYIQFSYHDGINALRDSGFSESAAVGFAEMARGFNEERIKRQPRSPETTTPTTIEDFVRDVFLPAWGN
jgi:uncharacterized protein YbjT (DUF2867 family)